jgi:putative transposase
MSHAKQLHNRRYFDDYMEIINRKGLPGNVKSELCEQVNRAVVGTTQQVIEQALEAELSAYLGAERYEHLPRGREAEQTRSGSYRRELITQYGRIADLRVPKLRKGNGALEWQTIRRYERCWGPFLDEQVMNYCLGLSLRDLQESIYTTLGEVLSVASCNRIVASVGQRAEAFKTQPLEAPPPIILVDGMWVKIAYPNGEMRVDSQGHRRAVKRKQKRVMLSALGVWPDGHWEIVHWQIAAGENEQTWKTFFGQLYAKGLTEETTRLVVSDGASGLETALDYHFYGVPHQRCIFHKIKNIADHLLYGDLEVDGEAGDEKAKGKAKTARKKAILADAGAIYDHKTEGDMRARAEVFRETWQEREPESVANFFTDFDKTLAYLRVDFPETPGVLIRTTNRLERFHKEMRRKQRDIGMFQSEEGCEAIWYLIATRETAKQQAALGLRAQKIRE